MTGADLSSTPTASRVLTRLRDLPVLVQDGAIVTVLLLVQCVALATSATGQGPGGDDARPVDLGSYALIVFATVPLLVRRRLPYLSLLATLLALLAAASLHYSGVYGGYAVLLAVYSVSAHRGLASGVTAAVVALVTLIASHLLVPWEASASDTVFDALALATAVALGDGSRNRARLSAEQSARLAAVTSEKEHIARQTVLDERARIARELHDLVAHSMSIVAVQAGVGHYLIDRDPDRAREALATIETTSREALTEMRRMLGVLRLDTTAEDRALEPQPGSADIGTLVVAANENGLDVELATEPDGELPELPSGVALSAYRIVQESLTNVRKHAGPARVRITLRCQSDRLLITVDDDGRGVSSEVSDRSEGPGFGLTGMRERASVLGGELHAGPRPGGGFRVQATLPIKEVP